MPIDKASQSIHLSEELARNHSVQFLVFSRLAGNDPSELHSHLKEHLAFQEQLQRQGLLGVGGPFFTADGKNTGNGLYVLRVDSLEQAREIASQDPLHKHGIRTATVEPWLQVIH